MRKRSRVYLSGVTGSVGSWLAGEALSRGYPVLAPVRGRTESEARDRVDSVLEIVGAGEKREDVRIVVADLLRENPGLESNAAIFDDVGLVIHCAACTSFRDADSEISRRTNVDGTRHALDLAARLRVPFIQISTAYIAGKRRGWVREDELDAGQDFNNVYERTKFEAEKLVHAWACETGLPVTILRPSIVVGDSQTGRAVRFNTLYGFMHVFDVMAKRIGNEEIRVNARPDATTNLIPVDYFARAAWRIIEGGEPGTYHVTNPSPITIEEFRNVFSRLFDADRIRLVTPEEFMRRKPTALERLYQRAAAVYAPYMVDEPKFDRTNADAALAGSGIELPEMDQAFFERLLAYARSVDWGRRKDALVEKQPNTPLNAESYFTDFLASKVDQRLLPGLKNLTASFGIALNGAQDGVWKVAIVEGAVAAVERNGAAADCTYRVDEETFAEVVSGRLAPQEAFFARRIKVEGNLETGMKLAAVLAEFFRQFPCEIANDTIGKTRSNHC